MQLNQVTPEARVVQNFFFSLYAIAVTFSFTGKGPEFQDDGVYEQKV